MSAPPRLDVRNFLRGLGLQGRYLAAADYPVLPVASVGDYALHSGQATEGRGVLGVYITNHVAGMFAVCGFRANGRGGGTVVEKVTLKTLTLGASATAASAAHPVDSWILRRIGPTDFFPGSIASAAFQAAVPVGAVQPSSDCETGFKVAMDLSTPVCLPADWSSEPSLRWFFPNPQGDPRTQPRTGATLWFQHNARYGGVGAPPAVQVTFVFRDLPPVI